MQIKFQKSKRLLQSIALILGLVFGSGTAIGYQVAELPDHYYAVAEEPLELATALPVSLRRNPDTTPERQEATVRLFGIIPLKTISVTTVERTEVYPGGEPFGIRMLMAGVMVVSLDEVVGTAGICCPAESAGIEVGDVIQTVNGQTVHSNDDVHAAVSAADGQPVQITLMRDGAVCTISVTPAYSVVQRCWQTGMWVRDSTAGIGTITYYTPAENGLSYFAGLGHPVCDIDTGQQIPLASGDVIGAQVSDIRIGTPGNPGALRGTFDTSHAIGTLLSNAGSGVYGTMTDIPAQKQTVELGFRQDIHEGEAELYTTLSGNTPQRFTVEIETIRPNDSGMRNLVVHVTDPDLLSQTGGIVQGMSGSPILQDGKLIGAVTHVFVKDPTRGYGIFAEHMYAQTTAQAAIQP